jgi:hypothetical protein
VESSELQNLCKEKKKEIGTIISQLGELLEAVKLKKPQAFVEGKHSPNDQFKL